MRKWKTIQHSEFDDTIGSNFEKIARTEKRNELVNGHLLRLFSRSISANAMTFSEGTVPFALLRFGSAVVILIVEGLWELARILRSRQRIIAPFNPMSYRVVVYQLINVEEIDSGARYVSGFSCIFSCSYWVFRDVWWAEGNFSWEYRAVCCWIIDVLKCRLFSNVS